MTCFSPFKRALAGRFLSLIQFEVDSIKYPAGTRDNPATNCKELADSEKGLRDGKKKDFFCLSISL